MGRELVTVKLSPRRRKALARLSRKDRRALATPIGDAIDDCIFGSMSDTLKRLARASKVMGGGGPGTVEVVKGVQVTLEPTEAKGWFGDRLREIDTYAQSLASTHELDLNDLRGRLLWADGWRVNMRTTKTPPWMEPHREIESHEVVRLVNLRWFPEIVQWYEIRNEKERANKISRGRKGQNAKGRGVRTRDAVVAG